jgi:hypothetical protein
LEKHEAGLVYIRLLSFAIANGLVGKF